MNDSFPDETLQNDVLLYDPLFESPPDTVIRDTPGRGFFGKAAVKKAVFIIVLLIFVGGAIVLSFASLAQDRLEYETTDAGLTLSAFRADKTDFVFCIDTAGEEAGERAGQPVTAVRQFAVCGNEVTAIILIGRDTVNIANTAFYDCAALAAVLVDENNPAYCSIDGVLYRCENGAPAELILCPRKNALYKARLALGDAAPADAEGAAAFAENMARWEQETGVWDTVRDGDAPEKNKNLTAADIAALAGAAVCEIPEGVTRVGEMAFAECPGLYEVTIPDTVTEIAQMAFFKCGNLRSLSLPDGVRTLGPDAFSYCKSLPEIYVPASVREIGHHACYGCSGVTEVRLAASEADAPKTGQDWLPKQRKLFERNVPVVYGAERGR